MNRHALRRALAAALVTSPAAFAVTGAHAAPQVLALFSTDRPVALACDAGACRAEMPTLCLQPGRRVPQPGRGYRLAGGAGDRPGGAPPRRHGNVDSARA